MANFVTFWATTHNVYSAGSRVRVYVEGPGGKSPHPDEAAWLTLGQPTS